MDIVVHGTKGGRQIFTPKKLGGLLDVNSDSSKASAIGQEVFAIRFVENNIIFSKYKIIRDVRGDKRTGFLAFSLFLPNNKKLQGIDIISLLNEVSGKYCKRYIPDNDNNLKDVREEWTFLDDILKEYRPKAETRSADDIETLLSGTKDDAFIYYENEQKLQKYFDAPFQDNYRHYRQVLFVKEELKNKPEDPLNALRHSEDNLTGKIDLENPKYRLLFKQFANGGLRVDVKVNGIARPSNSKIRRKDELEISWSKQFCITVTKKGNWNEISNEFIDVNDIAGSVSIREIIPPVETKTITFTIKDWKGNLITDAKISCKNADYDKPVNSNNQIAFIGEDLGKRWLLSASNDRFYTEERPINFVKDCPGDTGTIDIVLNKHELKKQQITVRDESNDVDLFDFSLSKTEFTGNEIKDTHKITISCLGFDSGSFTYCPETDVHLRPISLKKKKYNTEAKTTDSYNVSPGKNGTLKGGHRYTSNRKDGSDVRHLIIPNKGYKFNNRFEEQGNVLVAQYDKKENLFENPKFIASSIVGLIIIGFAIWALISFFGKERLEQSPQPDILHIKNYIEGDSLILDRLKGYKEILSEEQIEVLKSLDSAIKKRELINTWKFSELKKRSYYYYQAQQKFITAIEKIDSTQYDEVEEKIGDVSSLSLGQIADSINAILKITKPAITNTPNKNEDVREENDNDTKRKEVVNEANKEKAPTVITQQQKPEQTVERKPISPSPSSDKIAEIIDYLRGDELKKDVLNGYLNDAANNANLKKSIISCLKFWDLDGSKNNSYSSFQKEIMSDANLKSSLLKVFVDEMCKKDKPKYPIDVPGSKTITLKKLKNGIRQ